MHPNDHWISSRSVAFIESKKTVPASKDFDSTRRYLRRQLVKSLKDDRERWWTEIAQKMEKAFATGGYHTLFQLIRSTGSRKPGVSETITE